MQQDHVQSSPSQILRKPTPDAMPQSKTENVVEAQAHDAKSYFQNHCTVLRPADFARCNLFMFPSKAKDLRILSEIHASNTATREAGFPKL